MLVKPASTRLEEIPATYKTTTRNRPRLTGSNGMETRSGIEFRRPARLSIPHRPIPAKSCAWSKFRPIYETVKRTVLDQPARTREVTIPGRVQDGYETRDHCESPATTREVVIPAEYGTVKVTKLVQPARENRTAIPAEYKTVTKRDKTRDEKLAWRQVVCEVNLNASNVRSLQQALQKANRYDGPVDGILGPMTLSAANGLCQSERTAGRHELHRDGSCGRARSEDSDAAVSSPAPKGRSRLKDRPFLCCRSAMREAARLILRTTL